MTAGSLNGGANQSATQMFVINVTAVNDAPIADDDTFNVSEGGTLNEPAPGVLAGDTDVEGSGLTAVLVSGPAHASSFTLNADGSFSYTNDGSEDTTDSFTYRANDGGLDSNVATVTITIGAVDDAPVAVDDSYGVNEGATLSIVAPGVLANDDDQEGSPLTSALIIGPGARLVVHVQHRRQLQLHPRRQRDAHRQLHLRGQRRRARLERRDGDDHDHRGQRSARRGGRCRHDQ